MSFDADLFATDEVLARVRARLAPEPPVDAFEPVLPRRGDHALNPHIDATPALQNLRRAAVLVPLVAHEGGVTILLTQRASGLRDHAGQIAFPGGKIDEGETAIEAALREADEEIGLSARHIAPLAFLDPYQTGTGFRILPVVALVTPPFELAINHTEVDDAFEAPFSFLMNVSNHQRHAREWKGTLRHFYAMPYGERYIWGATAGILRNLYERLYS
jgi:8-oxo-dGTP pyrophosphatase MutT (NUDIX family)